VTDFTASDRSSATLLNQLERFYDAVPRQRADAEGHGPLTLFIRRGEGFPYYARPTRGYHSPVTESDVRVVRDRQRALGLPEEFEWVLETSPDVDAAVSAAGLAVQRCPLLVLDSLTPPRAPAGVTISLVSVDEPDLATVEAVAALAFGSPGTTVGTIGPAERDVAAERVSAGRLGDLRTRLRAGEQVRAVARGPEGPLAAGGYQHAEGVAEIVGVATLPSARRRGLGAAVTAALARHALDAGLRTVFLSAQDEDVARVYERVGFRRVATAGLASAPA
jgi:ribosomal protein S18 acetylase RimI-like enzyme